MNVSRLTSVIAIVLCLILFGTIQQQQLSPGERSELASRFRFSRVQLPEPSGKVLARQRNTNPSLSKQAAWISATGAAVALADVDADGLPNDLIWIDPRVGEIFVLPVPGTGERYQKFALNTGSLKIDDTMAPMGAFAGDFNEDGRLDIVAYYWGRTPIMFIAGTGSNRVSGRGSSEVPGKGSNQVPGKGSSEVTGKVPVKGSSEVSFEGSGKLSDSSFTAHEIVQTDGAGNPPIWNTSCGLASDLDGDGHLDLLFANYYQDGAPVLDSRSHQAVALQDSIARASNGGEKHVLLFRSAVQDTARFEECHNIFAPEVNHGWTLAAGACDLDRDGLPEIYFANDTGPDRLLHNRSTAGNLKFAGLHGESGFNTPSSFVLGEDSFKGMGMDFNDFNDDGVPDIYVSNIACPFGLEESHFLWLSTGSVAKMANGIAPYRQASEEVGLSRSGWSWDCRLADFDNDGKLEAVQGTGFLKGNTNRWPELQALGTANSNLLSNASNWPCFRLGDDVSGHEPNFFFARAKSGRMYDIAAELGVDDRSPSRGIAIGDVDADGDLDFVVANQWEPSYFYRNDVTNQNSSIVLSLLRKQSASTSAPSAVLLQDCSSNSDGDRSARPRLLASASSNSPAIGARVTAVLPDGTRHVAYVDGGTGHSGKRAHGVHYGVPKVDRSALVDVQIDWITQSGEKASSALRVPLGWHQIELVSPTVPKASSVPGNPTEGGTP